MMLALEKYPADWEGLITQMIEATQEAIVDASLHKVRHTALQGQQEKTCPGGSQYTFLLEDNWEPGAKMNQNKCPNSFSISDKSIWYSCTMRFTNGSSNPLVCAYILSACL